MTNDTCSVETCPYPILARGWCAAHYARWRECGDVRADVPLRQRAPNGQKHLPCSVDGCPHNVEAKGLCQGHYQRQYKDPNADLTTLLRNPPGSQGGSCGFPNCPTPSIIDGLCNAHDVQRKKGLELKPKRPIKPRGAGHLDKKGYVQISVDGKQRKEHIVVMEEIMGRKLYPKETVHHKNGVRDDNRPANLELWTGGHPYGQRVTDLLEWAHELIRTYENSPEYIV